MYNDKNIDYSKLSATEMIESINLDYYKGEIEKIEQQISNIRYGRPQFYGIYETSGTVYKGKEAEVKINDLEKLKEERKQELSQYEKFVVEAHDTLRSLDRIARERALMELFYKTLSSVLKPYDSEKKDFDNTETNKKYGKKVFKLISKEKNKVYNESRKINNKMYKALKKFSKKIRLKNFESSSTTLDSAIANSKHSIYDLFSAALWEMRNKYYEAPSSLGVNITELEHAINLMTSGNNDVSPSPLYAKDSDVKITELQKLQKLNLSSSVNRTVRSLLNSYEYIYQFAKEVEALHRVKKAFSDTLILDSAGYLNLKDVYKIQNAELERLLFEANENYKKIEILVEKNKKLEDLYRDYYYAKADLTILQEEDNYSLIGAKREEIRNIRNEMYAILMRYPELNQTKYEIDLKTFGSEEKKEEKSKDRLGLLDIIDNILNKPSQREQAKSVIDSESIRDVQAHVVESVQTPVIEPEQISVGNGKSNKTDIVYDANTSDNDLRKPIETPENLAGLATIYYPKYINEKVKNTPLGNLRYSEFLERVCPQLREYIELERSREQRAATVYKKYLQYRASLVDKSKAMKFSDYAVIYYNFQLSDIPLEYSDDGMKL